MKYLLILLLILTTLSGDDDHHKKRHINKELSHLNLSKEQSKKIKKILKEFRHDLKEFREYKEDIFLKDRLDTKELDRLNRALDAKSYEIENRLLVGMHSILSKKQRREFIHYFDDWEVR
ncbi:MAG: hypothetical protein PF437_00145 [Sulfurimonas sp.]|jgi:protein CpxP|nr:hypothetical protein [Sulfurimonas sp.]